MKEEVIHTTTSYPTTTATPVVAPTYTRRISWGAIIAGLIVALVTQILLTLLGVAIGAATVDPMQEQRPLEGLGTGAAIWWVVSSLISLFLGGCVAGRLAGVPRKGDGALHGIIMWGTATLITLLLAGSALGGLFGGAFSAFSAFKQASGQGAPPQLGEQIKGTLQRSGVNVDQIQQQAQQKIDQAQQKAQNAAQTGQVDQQTEQQARETGQKVASGTSKAALWGFIGLLLGALMAAWGGSAAAPREFRTVTAEPVARPV
jgi:hypothetical protein